MDSTSQQHTSVGTLSAPQTYSKHEPEAVCSKLLPDGDGAEGQTSRGPSPSGETSPSGGTSQYRTDGRAAWLALGASFYTVAIAISLTPIFGVLFSERLPRLGIQPQLINWIFTIHGTVWNLGIMVTNSVVMRFGYRKTAIFCSFLLSASFMLLSVAKTATHFFILYGFLIPITGAITSTVPYLLVPLHFLSRRGMALGILAMGISAGGIVTPLLVRFLQDEYGFVGACLIHGGVILNCCVAAALCPRPAPSKDFLVNKTCVIDQSDQSENIKTAVKDGTQKEKKSIRTKIVLVAAQIRSIKISNYKRLLVTGTSFAASLTGLFNFLRMVPFALESEGFSAQFAAQCLSAAYTSSTVTRGLISLVADQSWFSKRLFLIGGAVLSSSCTAGLIWIPASDTAVLLTMVSFGIGFGAYMSLFHVNCIDVHGMALYTRSVALNAALQAFAYLLVGYILDRTQAYAPGFTASVGVCAVLQLLSGVLWLLVPFVAGPRDAHAVAAVSILGSGGEGNRLP